LRAISKHKRPWAYLQWGDLIEVFFFFCIEFGALYLEGLIFGILWYLHCSSKLAIAQQSAGPKRKIMVVFLSFLSDIENDSIVH